MNFYLSDMLRIIKFHPLYLYLITFYTFQLLVLVDNITNVNLVTFI